MTRNCSSQGLKITKGKGMRTLYSIILMRFFRPLGPSSVLRKYSFLLNVICLNVTVK